MIYRFLILSDEVDDFKREIKIDADNTFYDLYEAIIQSTGYSEKEMASFFLCDDNWRKEKEITLVEMNTDFDEDSYIMKDCVLSDFLEDEKQKIMFVFDYMNDRALYIELSEIITGKTLKKPVCTVSEGEPPVQIKDIDETKQDSISSDLDENFYGDDGFDLEELDREGFDGLDDLPVDLDENDLY
jgi:hypothetical protein